VTLDQRLASERFPRSSQYHPEWVMANASGGANSLWVTEWLTTALDLRPGMRVLDLGCGRASSSIFLRREIGVQVWATDLWFSASENIAGRSRCVRAGAIHEKAFAPRRGAVILSRGESRLTRDVLKLTEVRQEHEHIFDLVRHHAHQVPTPAVLADAEQPVGCPRVRLMPVESSATSQALDQREVLGRTCGAPYLQRDRNCASAHGRGFQVAGTPTGPMRTPGWGRLHA